MFQAISGKLDEFVWWDLERIQTDAGMQFTSKEFQEGLSVHGVRLALSAQDHKEMYVQVEVTQHTLRIRIHSIMVHAWFSEKYIIFS